MGSKEDEWLTQLPKDWPWGPTQRDHELFDTGELKIQLGKTGIPVRRRQFEEICKVGIRGEGPVVPRSYARSLVHLSDSRLSEIIKEFSKYYSKGYHPRFNHSSSSLIDINEFARYIIHYNQYIKDAREYKKILHGLTNEGALRFAMKIEKMNQTTWSLYGDQSGLDKLLLGNESNSSE